MIALTIVFGVSCATFGFCVGALFTEWRLGVNHEHEA